MPIRAELDAFDIKILEALQADGRITILKLSEQVGLSASPCHARVRRLNSKGIVRRYAAEVDLKRLTNATTVMVPVEIKKHDAKAMRVFESEIAKTDEVVECHAVGGGFDYMLRVIARDVEAYQDLMDDLLSREIGIQRYYSYIVTKPVKPFNGFPLQTLLDED